MAEETKNTSFLTMAVGVAAVVIILAAVHGASQIISQFLMAFVITVAVAPVQAWLIRRGLRPLWAFLLTVVGLVLTIGLVIVRSHRESQLVHPEPAAVPGAVRRAAEAAVADARIARDQQVDDRVESVDEHQRDRAGSGRMPRSGF